MNTYYIVKIFQNGEQVGFNKFHDFDRVRVFLSRFPRNFPGAAFSFEIEECKA